MKKYSTIILQFIFCFACNMQQINNCCCSDNAKENDLKEGIIDINNKLEPNKPNSCFVDVIFITLTHILSERGIDFEQAEKELDLKENENSILKEFLSLCGKCKQIIDGNKGANFNENINFNKLRDLCSKKFEDPAITASFYDPKLFYDLLVYEIYKEIKDKNSNLSNTLVQYFLGAKFEACKHREIKTFDHYKYPAQFVYGDFSLLIPSSTNESMITCQKCNLLCKKRLYDKEIKNYNKDKQERKQIHTKADYSDEIYKKNIIKKKIKCDYIENKAPNILALYRSDNSCKERTEVNLVNKYNVRLYGEEYKLMGCVFNHPSKCEDKFNNELIATGHFTSAIYSPQEQKWEFFNPHNKMYGIINKNDFDNQWAKKAYMLLYLKIKK